ncbi:MAG: hypothetical protein DMF79_10940 [Acidobacteria bacterium]|nr:MAG: hypothetical protein DMF79_10940 [Acidobacteriota bacterium]
MVNSPDMPSKDPSRPVGPLQLLALGVNGIVGVGIFFTPATVAASAPGFAGVWVFLLTGLAVVPVAFAFAVLPAPPSAISLPSWRGGSPT